MLRDEIKQVEEIALIAAKTASIMAYNEIMAKIAALGKRIDKLELAKNEPEPEPVIASKKSGKKENE